MSFVGVAESVEVLERCGFSQDAPAQWSPEHARALTTRLLHGLPDRLAHSLQAGRQARRVVDTVPAPLEAAAVLHDIGYAPALRLTGFHPIDGATFLLMLGAPDRLAALVAHHSESWLLTDAAGLGGALSRFRREDGPVADALAYADMTAGPTGAAMTVPERLADIMIRHADEAPRLLAARQARMPRLMAAARRVQQRESVQP
jgi:hypothetical protein